MLQFTYVYGQEGYEKSKGLRLQVIEKEFGIPDSLDEEDCASTHILGFDGDKIVASARYTKMDAKHYRIAKVCVHEEYRGQYIADLMIRAMVDKIVGQGGAEVFIAVKYDCEKFYERLGFEYYSTAERMGPHQSVLMRRDLSNILACRGCQH